MPSHLSLVPNTHKTRASVIVPSRAIDDTTLRSIRSIIEHSSINDELIIVTAAKEAELSGLIGDTPITVVSYRPFKSFPGALNRGLAESNGEFIAIVRPDVMVAEGWLDRLIDHTDDEKIGAVGPICDRAGGIQDASQYLPQDRVMSAREWEEDDIPGEHEGLADIAAELAGNLDSHYHEAKLLEDHCVLLTKDCLEQIGGFDENIVLGNTDLDLAFSLQAGGFEMRVAADVFVSRLGYEDPAVEPELGPYLQQLSANRLAEKVFSYYSLRNQPAPSPTDLWGVSSFRTSPYRIGVAVVGESKGPIEQTMSHLGESSEAMLSRKPIHNAQDLRVFLREELDIFVLVKEGYRFNPGWISRLASAADTTDSTGIIYPSVANMPLDEEPTEHGLAVSELIGFGDAKAVALVRNQFTQAVTPNVVTADAETVINMMADSLVAAGVPVHTLRDLAVSCVEPAKIPAD